MYLRISIQGFFISDGATEALRSIKDERRLVRATVDCQSGGIPQACRVLANQPTPGLLIVETDENKEAMLRALGELAEVCDPATKVVVVGAENDILLYRQLLDMGIQEYLPGPVTSGQLLTTIDRLFASGSAAADCRILAFMGARGGAGSSTVAVNTAYCLAHEFSEEVVLLDLDLAFGTVALALNIMPNQNIAEAMLQSGRLDEVMLERFLSHYDEYLSVMAAPEYLDSNGQFDIGAFEKLMDVLSGRAAFIVLDLPQQWAPWIHNILIDANEVVITATADLASLRTTKKLFEQLSPKRGVDAPIRVVLNNTGASKKSELSPDDFEKAVSVKPCAFIPNNPPLFGKALNNGELVAQSDAKSAPAQQFAQLATILSGRAPVSAKPKRFSLIRGFTA